MHQYRRRATPDDAVNAVRAALQVSPREAVVPAGGELALEVQVLLDDAVTFKDVLHVLVADGADVSIALEATGSMQLHRPGFSSCSC